MQLHLTCITTLCFILLETGSELPNQTQLIATRCGVEADDGKPSTECEKGSISRHWVHWHIQSDFWFVFWAWAEMEILKRMEEKASVFHHASGLCCICFATTHSGTKRKNTHRHNCNHRKQNHGCSSTAVSVRSVTRQFTVLSQCAWLKETKLTFDSFFTVYPLCKHRCGTHSPRDRGPTERRSISGPIKSSL